MYEFKTIENIKFEELAKAWNSAFSDYVVPMSTTPKKIEAYFKVSGVDKSKSFGVFYENNLVGMLINSVDTFKGKIVAYDAMTGITPEHRGKGLFSKLFEYSKSCLKSRGITHYFLEVITTNEKAFSIYKKKGGKIVREFSVLEGKINRCLYRNLDVKVTPLSEFSNKELADYEPSFGNRISALNRNIDEYKVAYAETAKGKSAVIFDNAGRIPQVMYNGNDSNSLHAVLTYLSQTFENLCFLNIPVSESDLTKELLNCGFRILINQYEMCIAF